MEFKPTKCTILSMNTSIHDSVKQLEFEKSSYAVIINPKDEIIGMVTEKDFLKNLESLVNQDLTETTIRMIMSHPVKTLTVDMLHLAPEFMLENGFRRVPIMSRKNTTKISDLVGIITEKSILQAIVRNRGLDGVFARFSYESKKILGILSGDGEISFELDKIFESSDFVSTHRLRYTKLQTSREIAWASGLCDAIVMDIDNAPMKSWTTIVKAFNEHPEMETVFVAYTPSLHSEDIVNLMRGLKGKSIFHIYEKPLDIVTMVNDLDRVWSANEKAA